MPHRRVLASFLFAAALMPALPAQTTVTYDGFTPNPAITYTTTLANPLTLTTTSAAVEAAQSGVISGNGSVTKTGDGQITLSGANTYTGGTALSVGTLGIGNDAALGAGALTIFGGTLRAVGTAHTIGTAVIVNGDFNFGRFTTISGDVTLATDVTLTLFNTDLDNTGSESVISGVISGNHNLTIREGQNPGGTKINFVLSGANTFTGETFLGPNAHLTLRNPLALQASTFNYAAGAFSFGTLTSATLGGLKSENAVQLALTNSALGAVALTVGGNNSSNIYEGVISGGGSLTKTGTGALVLTNTNTYSGGTTVTGGLIGFSSLANFGSGAITLNGGGLYWTSGNVDVSARLAALGDGGGTLDTNGHDVIVASALTGPGALTKTSAGTLTLAADNSYSGGTVISAGALQIGNNGTSGSIAGDVTDNAALVFNRSDDLTYAGAISGSGTVTKLGNGTLTLLGDDAPAGGTTISAGILQIGDGGTSGALSGSIVDNATLAFNRSDKYIHNGTISGPGVVIQLGTGILNLGASNTYSGGTVIDAGTIGLGANDALGTGTLTINGGGIRAAGSARTVSNAVVLAGDFTLGRATNFSGAVSLANDITITSANPDTGAATTSTFSGVISGSHGLTFTEGGNPIGAIVLSGANTYTGDTVLQNGKLTLGNTLALQASTFDYQGGTLGFGSLTSATFGGLTGTQALALANDASGAVVLTVGGNNAGTTFDGVLSGDGSLTKTGAGTLALTATNTYSGGTTVTGGRVKFSSLANLGSGAIVLNGGGLQWASGNVLDVSSRIADLGAAGAIFDTNGNNVTFANGLGGAGSLVKAGAGTLALAGANTYAGDTTVSGGTLSLAAAGNALASSGTLYLSGGTLELNGGTQTFAALGTSARPLAGNITAGTITTTGNLYLASGNYATTFTGSSASGRLWIGGDSGATVTLNGTNDRVYTTDHNQVIIGYATTGAAGTVKLGNANALAAATENVEVWNGTLDLNGQAGVRASAITLQDDAGSRLVNNNPGATAGFAGTVFLNNDGNGGPVSSVGGAGNLELSGTLVGTYLNKTGGGTLTLANDSFFTNPTYPLADYGRQLVLASGTLSLGGSATQFNLGDVASNGIGTIINFNGGALRFATANDATFRNGYYQGTSGYALFDTTGKNITLQDAYFDSSIIELAKTGAGTLTFATTGPGNYAHDYTYVQGGTLALTAAGQLGRHGFWISNGATLDLGGSTQTTAAGDSGYATYIDHGSIRNGTLATNDELTVTGGGTLDATFTGSGSSARLWLDSGVGETLYLGGANERIYTPDHNQVIIGYNQASTVKLLGADALAAATENVEVWNGTLDLNGQTSVRANSLVLKSGAASRLVNDDLAHAASFAGAVVLGSGTPQLGGNGSLTLSGAVSGTGFEKTGSGALTMTGTNSFAGAVAVSAGALFVNGAFTSTALTINPGAQLGGSGSIASPTTLASGACLAPGNSSGTITFTQGLTLAAGSALNFELGATGDLVRVSGGTLTGPSGTEGILLNFTNAGGFAADVVYPLFDFTGAGTADFDAGDFAFGTTIPGYSYALTLDGNVLNVTASALTAVPEPATDAAWCGLGVLAVAAWRRRKGRRA